LLLIEDKEELSLGTGGECSSIIERFLEVPSPEPLSPAALQVLAIVAYEQPVTRADISRTRGVHSDGVVASLLLRGLVAEERRFAVAGGLLPLITTASFLRHLGLGSLRELRPLATEGAALAAVTVQPGRNCDQGDQECIHVPGVGALGSLRRDRDR